MNWMHASASCTQHAAMHRQIRTSEMHNNNQSNPEKNTNLAVLVPSSIPIRSIVHSIIVWHLWNHITNRNTRIAWKSKTWKIWKKEIRNRKLWLNDRIKISSAPLPGKWYCKSQMSIHQQAHICFFKKGVLSPSMKCICSTWKIFSNKHPVSMW